MAVEILRSRLARFVRGTGAHAQARHAAAPPVLAERSGRCGGAVFSRGAAPAGAFAAPRPRSAMYRSGLGFREARRLACYREAMRQLTCTGPRRIEWRDVPEPRIEGDGEALVRPLAVARCEIDPFLISGLIPSRGPFALGHESVAEVVELARDVRGLEIGQHVVVAFQVSCGQCLACTAGHSGNCDRYPVLSDYGMRPLSGVEYGGMLSDLLRVPHAESAILVPPTSMPRSTGMLSLPGQVHRARARAG